MDPAGPGCGKLEDFEALCLACGVLVAHLCAAPSGGASGPAAAKRVLNQEASDDEDTIENEEQDQR
jgi:hypothetical protein